MEFEWVLHEEVHAVLNQLHTILLVSAFNVIFRGLYLILYSSNIKCTVRIAIICTSSNFKAGMLDVASFLLEIDMTDL
jgi:hypothetical protein